MHRSRLLGVTLVLVRGRSMRPTLAEGDVLLVDRRRRVGARARPGRLAVVRLSPDRPVSVKRLGVRDADGWWVERDNPREGVDSWQLGVPVPDGDLLGLVVLRVWPRPFRLPPAPPPPPPAKLPPSGPPGPPAAGGGGRG